MSCILSIETSTHVCSVALSAESIVLFERSSFEGLAHATLVGVYVEEALKVLKEKGLTLDAVAVSSGPGSYTGLRIGVSVAKGVCFGLGIPLISVPTLKLLALTAVRHLENTANMLYCAMIDARRMEVYAAIYDENLVLYRDASADIVTEETYASWLSTRKVCFFGNGAAKCQQVITSPNALFIEDINPLAKQMVPLAEKAFETGKFENVAYFEPFYLKEFQATIAKNKVLKNK